MYSPSGVCMPNRSASLAAGVMGCSPGSSWETSGVPEGATSGAPASRAPAVGVCISLWNGIFRLDTCRAEVWIQKGAAMCALRESFPTVTIA